MQMLCGAARFRSKTAALPPQPHRLHWYRITSSYFSYNRLEPFAFPRATTAILCGQCRAIIVAQNTVGPSLLRERVLTGTVPNFFHFSPRQPRNTLQHNPSIRKGSC
jgi:hypothetical protein